MGYDISDYKDIDPKYGTIADVDNLIAELKKRDMKLMMDLVVNHTSDEVFYPTILVSCFSLTSNQHMWFQESRKSRDSPFRDWYIWKKPRRSSTGAPLPPNNWSMILGDANSAWTYDADTDEYYLSLFTPEQPDLNWENPNVRAAVHDVMNFWLDRGACGYRMDVINLISKDPKFPDATALPNKDRQYFPGTKYYVNGPRMHEYLQEIKHKVLAPHKAITVDEMPHVSDINEIIRTVGAKSGELNMIFIFDIVELDTPPGWPRMNVKPFSVKEMGEPITKWQTAMIEHDGWNSVFIENHDNPRSVSRYTCDSDIDNARDLGAKLLALMQTTQSGTLFVYQGEELGMRNVPAEWDVSEYKDIESINYWKACLKEHGGDEKQLAKDKEVLIKKARDHARTPMQWSGAPHGGFCEKSVEPWMRANDDYPDCNAEKQMRAELDDDLSVWQFWQRGLANRKAHADVFVYGSFDEVDDGSHGVYAYARTGNKGGKWLIALNFTGQNVLWKVPAKVRVRGWMAGNYLKGKPEKATEGEIDLRPWEGLLGVCRE